MLWRRMVVAWALTDCKGVEGKEIAGGWGGNAYL